MLVGCAILDQRVALCPVALICFFGFYVVQVMPSGAGATHLQLGYLFNTGAAMGGPWYEFRLV